MRYSSMSARPFVLPVRARTTLAGLAVLLVLILAGRADAQQFRYPSPRLSDGTLITEFAPVQHYDFISRQHNYSPSLLTEVITRDSLRSERGKILVPAPRQGTASTSALTDSAAPLSQTTQPDEQTTSAQRARDRDAQGSRPYVSFGFDTSALVFISFPLEVEVHPLPWFSVSIPYQRSPDVKLSDAGFNRTQYGLRTNFYLGGVRRGESTWIISAMVLKETFQATYTQELTPDNAEPVEAALEAAGLSAGDPGFDEVAAIANDAADAPSLDLKYTGEYSRNKYSFTVGRRKQGKLFYRRTDFGLAVKGGANPSLTATIPNTPVEFSKEVELLPPIFQLPFTFGSSFGVSF